MPAIMKLFSDYRKKLQKITLNNNNNNNIDHHTIKKHAYTFFYIFHNLNIERVLALGNSLNK